MDYFHKESSARFYQINCSVYHIRALRALSCVSCAVQCFAVVRDRLRPAHHFKRFLDPVYTDLEKFLNGQKPARIPFPFWTHQSAGPCKFLNGKAGVLTVLQSVTEFAQLRINAGVVDRKKNNLCQKVFWTPCQWGHRYITGVFCIKPNWPGGTLRHL